MHGTERNSEAQSRRNWVGHSLVDSAWYSNSDWHDSRATVGEIWVIRPIRRTPEMDLMAALADLNYLLKIYQLPVQCIGVICELKSRSAVVEPRVRMSGPLLSQQHQTLMFATTRLLNLFSFNSPFYTHPRVQAMTVFRLWWTLQNLWSILCFPN